LGQTFGIFCNSLSEGFQFESINARVDARIDEAHKEGDQITPTAEIQRVV
jgi:hypothetical protein